ncbi:MAG: metallophosphoesterase [Bacteroidales bacterium]|nr:metallophosphoesterase [Bacteroidales bacterium]
MTSIRRILFSPGTAWIICLVTFVLLLKCGMNNSMPNDQSYDTLIIKPDDSDLSFIIFGDWGRNAYYYQDDVAKAMGEFCDSFGGVDFIISCGDNFQTNGVASIADPLWNSSFENVYTHPSLLVDWYPVLGNHDYKGNTNAEIQYSSISRRWRMTDNYYSIDRQINDSVAAKFLFIDTSPLIDYYHGKPETYPDVVKQDTAKQMQWIRETLKNVDEEWIFAIGHHPVFSGSPAHGNTDDLIEKLKPVFDRSALDFYFCGHDHDFQHIKATGSHVEYFVTGTGSQIRETGITENTVFSLAQPGFTVVILQGTRLYLHFLDIKGNIKYSIERSVFKATNNIL